MGIIPFIDIFNTNEVHSRPTRKPAARRPIGWAIMSSIWLRAFSVLLTSLEIFFLSLFGFVMSCPKHGNLISLLFCHAGMGPQLVFHRGSLFTPAFPSLGGVLSGTKLPRLLSHLLKGVLLFFLHSLKYSQSGLGKEGPDRGSVELLLSYS